MKMKSNIIFFFNINNLIKLVIMATVLVWFTHSHRNIASNKKNPTCTYILAIRTQQNSAGAVCAKPHVA